MKKVMYPLDRRTRNSEVGNLRNVLQLLLERGLLLEADRLRRRSLSRAIGHDRGSQIYSMATAELVGIFQKERRLEANGNVDEPTPKALHGILQELDVLKEDDQDGLLPDGSKNSVKLVSTMDERSW